MNDLNRLLASAALLRARGYSASVLSGGIEAWRDAGAPVVAKAGWPGREETEPSRWVTRAAPRIDRIACAWFIRRFVDRTAEFLFVEADRVAASAEEIGGIPFDIDGVEFSHRGDGCSFDTFLDRFGIDDAALRKLAGMVRGADTGRLDLAPQAAGLLAVSRGISAIAADDEEALECGLALFDALYAWCRSSGEGPGSSPARRTA
ncbi:MAG: chromate resistance protein [Inquilinus sp.]|nr:chromate resistance protein [Inquilinus sp.]